MTVKKLVAKCLEKLGEQDFTGSSTMLESQKRMQDKLVYAINAVYREIITEYIPLVTSERAEIRDGKIRAAALSKQVIYPIRVSVNGEDVKFAADAENICVRQGDGTAEVTYAYMPSEALKIDGSMEILGASEDMLSDGAISQYYLAEGVYDLAKIYDMSYRDKLWKLRYKDKSMRLKERRWPK